MTTDQKLCGYVTNGPYTCNGSPRGCEGERFGGCRYCDERRAALNAMTQAIEHYDPIFAAGFCAEMARQVDFDEPDPAASALDEGLVPPVLVR